MHRGTALLAGLALLAAPAASARAEATAADAALARLKAEAGGSVLVGRHAGSGRIRTLKGKLSPPGEGSPEATARRFLEQNAALLGLKADAADLAVDRLREGPGTHLRFRQTCGGLPVFNGGLEVTLDRERRVFLVNSNYASTDGLDLTPRLSAAEGVAAARADLPRGVLSGDGQSQLGVFLDRGTPRLAWRFVLEAQAPFAVVEYTVDARTGAILQRRDLLQGIDRNGWGQVFDPNPVNTLNNGALADNADADGAAFAAAYLKVPLKSLDYKVTTGEYFLGGPYVHVSDAIQEPLLFRATAGVVTSKAGGFRFDRAADEFEHVMCYHHIDANQRYIQGLGFQDVNRRPIRVDPHGFAAGGGSGYVANPVGAGYLVFGTGGVDDAEDADVILHEYAHALQDNQAPGKYLGVGTEAAAMGEGFADYWAASSTYDASVANGFDPACVGEWDAAPGCIGRVDGTKHYPEDLAHNADSDGELWAGALWDLFLSTADRGATDSIILQSHYLVPDNPTFADGVDALLAADDLLFQGVHHGNICSVMFARGLRSEECGFTATVTWDNVNVDLDLRLRPPAGAGCVGFDCEFDCSYESRNPDWGIPGNASDNPFLRIDCRNYSCTLEQIVLKSFTTPGTYQVLVHFYEHNWGGIWQNQTTTAEVRVYLGGVERYRGSRVLENPENSPDTGELWVADTIEVTPP